VLVCGCTCLRCAGASFYIEGSKLLGQDVQYAIKLVIKAVLGDTLQPREVRSLRRTAKDVVTFIPFIIILIIPLSPVGHVLVFSFIQRFFPDFFPTPYTDRRQNLMRIYQSVEMPMGVVSPRLNKRRGTTTTINSNKPDPRAQPARVGGRQQASSSSRQAAAAAGSTRAVLKPRAKKRR
jgi:hypothetical protein